jgi:pimeloyl-[acyl-carrier protein] synthase
MLRLIQRLMGRTTVVRLLDPGLGGFNPWLPANRRDPYPMYRRLRERAPVVRAPLLGAWLATRWDECEEILRERQFSADRSELAVMRMLRRGARDAPEMLGFIESDLLMLAGPRHARLRRLVSKAFTPRRVETLEPRIETLVAELLDRAAARGEMDVVRDLAAPLPAAVIGELLGVPAEDRERLRSWSDELAELLDPLSGREGLEPPRRATRGLAVYFRGLLDERRRAPRDDLLTALAAAEEPGAALTETEILALCQLLLAAGHETTTNLIANAVLALLRYPDERRRLQDDPGLLANALEEILRFESPVQLTDRVATEDCELGGRRIRRGQLVGVLLASANRDPKRFADPDRLDVTRDDVRHLAFGHGAHFCLGAQLARIEARLALGALLRRFPDFTGSPEPPGWKRSSVLRGPTSLPLHLGGAARAAAPVHVAAG